MSPYSFSTAHPLLFQKLQSEENLLRATTNISNPVTEFILLPDDVNEFNDLKTHPLFPKIQSSFLGDILKLKELAHHYVDSHYDKDIQEFHNKILGLQDRLHIEPTTIMLYRDTRFQLHRLVQQLNKTQSSTGDTSNDTHTQYLTHLLNDCLTGINLCFDGVYSRFSQLPSDLEASKSELGATFLRIRKELFRQCIGTFMQKLKDGGLIITYSSEIHWYNGIYNLQCEKLGLPKITDRYAETLNKIQIAIFRQTIKQSVTPVAILRQFATEWADCFSEAVKNKGLSAWMTDPIDINEFSSGTMLDSFFKPLNDTMKSISTSSEFQSIGIWTLLDEQAKNRYCLGRYREKLLAWVCLHSTVSAPRVVTEIPKTKHSPATSPEHYRCLSHCYTIDGSPALSANGPQDLSPPLFYIGTIGDTFYWVFQDGKDLSAGQEYNFDNENHITLTLAHLINIDFCTFPEITHQGMLTQAMEQTQKIEDIAHFFFK